MAVQAEEGEHVPLLHTFLPSEEQRPPLRLGSFRLENLIAGRERDKR